MFRNTYLKINVDNLYHNCNLFTTKTGKRMMAVVKANAYGTVDYKIAKLLEKQGVDFFAVSSIEEALRLREHDIKSNILIMGYVENFTVCKDNNLSIIIPSLNYAKRFSSCLEGINVHIKINTGLNRLGLYPDETKEVLNLLLQANANVEGIMTHFACVDDVDYTYKQYYLFKEVVESLDFKFKYVHTSASDAALYLEDTISNYIRIGLGLFGYANIEHDWDLKPCLSLIASVVECKKVPEGDGVSYGHKYVSDGEGYILTASIGYADGVDRRLENRNVLVGDEECTIVGRICMDLIMIKAKKPHEIDEAVEIIGEHHTVEDRRDELDSCCCAIITGISERVTKLYTSDNRIIDEYNFSNK